MRRSARHASLALLLAACGRDEALGVDAAIGPDVDAQPEDAAPDVDAAPVCTPGTIDCVRSTSRYVECAADGTIAFETICGIGCWDNDSCAEILPSNGLGAHLLDARTGPDLTFTGASSIDTTTGAVTNDGVPVVVPSTVVDGMRVFQLHSLRIEGTVRATGALPLVFLTYDTVVIDGLLDASSDRGGTTGPGAGVGCAAPVTVTAASVSPGGGGGSHVESGGAGGAAGNGTPGGAAGPPRTHTRGVPLVGGCPGADVVETDVACRSSGGAGGGVVQISARVALTLTENGRIDASGAGGSSRDSGTCSSIGGGGGGSGGLVLLESVWSIRAPEGWEISIAVTGGGGAAAGDGCVTCNGSDGAFSITPAAGGTGAAGAAGGAGSVQYDSQSLWPEAGRDGSSSGADGGGGGGRNGVVELRAVIPSSSIWRRIAGDFYEHAVATQVVPP